ncbi:MAG: hypothetical protein JSS24_09830 [Proteobacteria bacterium]|nr:hypothetical protein [Pseudomonadota bacterium]
MNSRRVSIIGMMLIGFGTTISCASTAPVSSWWQTECIEGGPSEPSTCAVVRRFETPNAPIEDEKRLLVVQNRDLQYRVDATRGSVKWENLDRVVLQKVGTKNPALIISIVVNGVPIGGNPFGVIEYSCWRAMEAILMRHVSEKIQESPPPPHFPLFDKNGNIVSE